jgi:hypothetical protein
MNVQIPPLPPDDSLFEAAAFFITRQTGVSRMAWRLIKVDAGKLTAHIGT